MDLPASGPSMEAVDGGTPGFAWERLPCFLLVLEACGSLLIPILILIQSAFAGLPAVSQAGDWRAPSSRSPSAWLLRAGRPRREAFARPGDARDLLARAAGGACVPGTHGTVTFGGIVLSSLPTSGPCTDSRLTRPSVSVKKPYLLVLEPWPVGQTSDLIALWRPAGALARRDTGRRHLDTLPLLRWSR